MLDPDAFPKDFLWGASTASHQVEGGTENQWSVWELAHATELARTAEERLGWLPSWPDIKERAEDPENYVSGKGVDHYNRYEEDFDLLQKLNLNSYRFGIEWSRIEPQEGVWNLEAVQHYHRYLKALKKRGVTPMLNLWHWTMPTWFTDKGAFAKKENLQYFERFVEKIAEEYGHELTYVLTLNEPNVYASFSYMSGEWPPQQRSVVTGVKVYWHLVQAHRRAYEILKRANPKLQIGVAAQLANIQSKRPHNLLDVWATKWMRYFWNWWFLNRTRKHQDFIGLNYYFTDYYVGYTRRSRKMRARKQGNDQNVAIVQRINPHFPENDLGWYMEPEGLYPLLLRVWAHYRKPIIITENGLADENDTYRRWWIEESVIAMRRAMSEGVDVRGYMHWSLLDNFEWKYGWWPKFGLIEVDREHGMKRTPRPSAIWFAKYLARLQGKGGKS